MLLHAHLHVIIDQVSHFQTSSHHDGRLVIQTKNLSTLFHRTAQLFVPKVHAIPYLFSTHFWTQLFFLHWQQIFIRMNAHVFFPNRPSKKNLKAISALVRFLSFHRHDCARVTHQLRYPKKSYNTRYFYTSGFSQENTVMINRRWLFLAWRHLSTEI